MKQKTCTLKPDLKYNNFFIQVILVKIMSFQVSESSVD